MGMLRERELGERADSPRVYVRDPLVPGASSPGLLRRVVVDGGSCLRSGGTPVKPQSSRSAEAPDPSGVLYSNGDVSYRTLPYPRE